MNRSDSCDLLRHVLERSAAVSGVLLTIARTQSTRWASATFTGARHELAVATDASPAAADWLAGLPEADLALAGHLVADLKVITLAWVPTGREVVLEILTVEDR